MAVKQKEDILREIEELREKLYLSADKYVLSSQEIYEASVNLDRVIVKYLREEYADKCL